MSMRLKLMQSPLECLKAFYRQLAYNGSHFRWWAFNSDNNVWNFILESYWLAAHERALDFQRSRACVNGDVGWLFCCRIYVAENNCGNKNPMHCSSSYISFEAEPQAPGNLLVRFVYLDDETLFSFNLTNIFVVWSWCLRGSKAPSWSSSHRRVSSYKDERYFWVAQFQEVESK